MSTKFNDTDATVAHMLHKKQEKCADDMLDILQRYDGQMTEEVKDTLVNRIVLYKEHVAMQDNKLMNEFQSVAYTP